MSSRRSKTTQQQRGTSGPRGPQTAQQFNRPNPFAAPLVSAVGGRGSVNNHVGLAHAHSQSAANASKLVLFANKDEANDHAKKMRHYERHFEKADMNERMTMFCPSCGSQGTCCGSCSFLDDCCEEEACCFNERWVYTAYEYDYPDGIQIISGPASQVITSIDEVTAEVTTFAAGLPVPATGQSQIVSPNGFGFGSGTPAYSLFLLSNVRDNNSPAAAANPAHLLNTLWIVNPSTTPNVWRIHKVSICGYNIGDISSAVRYMNSSSTLPSPFILEINAVNVPESTIGFQRTNYASKDLVLPLSVVNVDGCRCECAGNHGDCDSDDDGDGCNSHCSGGWKCNTLRTRFNVINPYALHPAQQNINPLRRLSASIEEGVSGYALDPRSGRVVAAHITRRVSKKEAHQLKKLASSAQAREEILYEQYERNALIEDQMYRAFIARQAAENRVEDL